MNLVYMAQVAYDSMNADDLKGWIMSVKGIHLVDFVDLA